jgi:hypothetical protein
MDEHTHDNGPDETAVPASLAHVGHQRAGAPSPDKLWASFFFLQNRHGAQDTDGPLNPAKRRAFGASFFLFP